MIIFLNNFKRFNTLHREFFSPCNSKSKGGILHDCMLVAAFAAMLLHV